MTLITEPFKPATKRRSNGQYIVVNGGKERGYSRATTVVKAVSTTDWGPRDLRSLAQGFAAHAPEFVPRVRAAGDSYSELTKVVNQILDRTDCHAGRNHGTRMHDLIEQRNLGRTPTMTPAEQRDADAYMAAMAAAGVTVLPDMMERIVVWDEHEIAGTLDNIVRMPTPCPMCDGLLRIADLKTGKTMYVGELAIQLHIYANSVLYDQQTETRTPLPEGVCTHWGLGIHLPKGEGRCVLQDIDLSIGAQGLAVALAVRSFGKGIKPIVRHEVTLPEPDDGKTLEQLIDSIHGTQVPPSAENSTTAPAAEVCGNQHTPIVEQQLTPSTDTAVSVLNARIDALRAPSKDHPSGRVALLKAHWPATVPMGKVTAQHTAADVAAILTAIEATERNEFPPDAEEAVAKPAAPVVEPLVRPTPDEGGPLDPERAAAIKATAANKKEANVRSWNKVSAMLSDLRQIGHRLDMTAPTVRTGALLEAVMALAEWDDVDTQRAMLARVTGCEQALFPTTRVAEFISTLTIDEARALHALCTSDLRVAVSADGRVVLEVAA